MGPVRLDENSTNSSINEVFEMQKGEVFGIAPEFLDTFIKLIPTNRFFKFALIAEGSPDFVKYGSNCYRVVHNEKLIVF